MGERGPVPKRTEERIRRNTTEYGGEVEKVTAIGVVQVPELGFDDPHPMISEFWDSLKDSAQSKYYEPSDWQFARWVLYTMNDYLTGKKPSAVMFQAINSALSDLLVTEGERRRVRMEVEREAAKEAAVVDIASLFRERMASN